MYSAKQKLANKKTDRFWLLSNTYKSISITKYNSK